MSRKVVDFDIGEAMDRDFDVLILIRVPLKSLIPDSPETVPKPWSALSRAGGRRKQHGGCSDPAQRKNA